MNQIKLPRFVIITLLSLIILGSASSSKIINAQPDVTPTASGSHVSFLPTVRGGQPTYYVATNGRDGWPGTEQQPFRTIQRGVNELVPGDTLLIKNGTYVEEVDVSRSGTAAAPITIKAFHGHRPVIDGQTGVNGINNGLPEGEIAGRNPNNGAGFKYTGLFDITGSHIVVDGLTIRRSMGRGMRIFSRPGQTVSHVTIRNCHVHDNRSENILFFGRKEGANLSVRYVTVDGCDLSGSGDFYQGRRSPQVANWPGNLSYRSVENIVVRNSVIHENWGEAILLDSVDGGSRSATIEDNVFYDNYAPLFLHGVSDVVVRRNYFYRSSSDKANSNPFGPTEAIALSSTEQNWLDQIPTQNIRLINNIVVGEGRGIAFRESGLAPINNVFTAYNTIINSTIVGVAAKVENKDQMVFRNNIVYSAIGTDLVYDGGQTDSGWTFSNNMYSSRPTALNGLNDVIGNPLFRNANGSPAAGYGNPANYQIRAGSPAIDAANKVAEPKYDFFGNHRSGTPDIGAHEQNGR